MTNAGMKRNVINFHYKHNKLKSIGFKVVFD